ncbi:MAG TPA: DnaJ domain-containing protein [Rhizobiaceae bacterium]|nr:DnaJ domain-containing protein [Rhizobiaceae bacterium]
MAAAFYLVAFLLVVGLLAVGLIRVDAARLAAGLRMAGPISIGGAGVILMLIGRAGVGGALISGALAWHAYQRKHRSPLKTAGRRSNVRTTALEMELDHDTGGLEGTVLAGKYAGRTLGQMSMPDLLDLRAEFGGDDESRRLLETYLDSRFPVWRHDAEADVGQRQRTAPGAGTMTKEEAYKILGLEPGAPAADVRKAHRRLMQRLHPDLGGSSFLAARINEAKDVLLSDHG